jgi:hypothetical protein
VDGRRTNYYERDSFADTFARYLAAESDKAVQAGHTTPDQHNGHESQAGHKSDIMPDTEREKCVK